MMENEQLPPLTEEEIKGAKEMAEAIFTPSDGRTPEEWMEDLFTPVKEQKIEATPDELGAEVLATVSPETFSKYYFNQTLFGNQVDMVKAILDPVIRKVEIVEPRQVGKTSAIATASGIALEQLGTEYNEVSPNEPYRVGIFSPKLGQAQIDVNRLKRYCERNKKAYRFVNWNESNSTKLVWHNGSELHAVSASEQAETEGQTFNLIIMEEAQRISDYSVSEKILPMGGATGSKIVKVGTVRAVRNHFWKSWHDPQQGYHKVSHTWMTCPNLLRGGWLTANINGDQLKLSRYVMDRMPLSIKQQLYPSNPELWTHGDMDEADFRTQYLLEWLETQGLYLSERERTLLIGTHELQMTQVGQEYLVAGIDFAGSDSDNADETSISVLRVTNAKVKEKIWGCTFRGDPMSQLQEIVNILHPYVGKFRPRKILADATGIGLYPVAQLRASGLPVDGINFGATEPDSALSGLSMNYKNAMCSYTKSEIDNGRFKYAKKQQYIIPEMNVNYHKGLDQWFDLEVENTDRINKQIGHADGAYDDVVMSDVLAVFASKTERTILPQRNQMNSIRVAFAHPGIR